jgi:hypothetical protein
MVTIYSLRDLNSLAKAAPSFLPVAMEIIAPKSFSEGSLSPEIVPEGHP